MRPASSARHQFVNGGLVTASPQRVVEMAFERLDRDLTAALEALARRDIERCHGALCHAQELVVELNLMLDHDAWEHTTALSSIYLYVVDVLTRANVRKSAADVEHARSILAEIGGAFSAASASLHAGGAMAPTGAPPLADTAHRPLSLRA